MFTHQSSNDPYPFQNIPGGRCLSIFAGVVTWPPIRRPGSPPPAVDAAAFAVAFTATLAATEFVAEEDEEEPCCVAGSRIIGPEVMMTSGSPLPPGGVAVPAAEAAAADDNIETVESALRFKGRLNEKGERRKCNDRKKNTVAGQTVESTRRSAVL